MKKTISLILGMFLILLSGCGKSKQLVSPLDPPAGTQIGSETQSEETTEKQQEETKSSWLQWGPTKFVAKWTLIAATAYGLYKLTRYVLGEEEWNRIMNPPQGEQQPAGQQNQAMDNDEYSEGGVYRKINCLIRGEGIDNSIRNEKAALDARLNGGLAPVIYPNVAPIEGQPTRLASKNGNIVRIDHEERYKAKWEAYKKEHYPADLFS